MIRRRGRAASRGGGLNRLLKRSQFSADQTVDMRRTRPAADRGFTLIELLVVLLIMAVLITIGLGTFLAQRSKAEDADAKTSTVAAATAMTIYHGDHETYATATPAELAKIEISLGRARGLTVSGGATTFKVSVDSAAGGTFAIERLASGVLQRTCTQPGVGGCSSTVDALGDRW